jgi:hypothetical protein
LFAKAHQASQVPNLTNLDPIKKYKDCADCADCKLLSVKKQLAVKIEVYNTLSDLIT